MAWGGPESLGGNVASAPSAVSWVPAGIIGQVGLYGRLDVFGVTTTRTLQHWWWDNGWGGPESLGGKLVGSPSAVSWAAGRLDVFGVDDYPRTLQHWWWDNGWGGPESLGGNFGPASAPSAVSWAPGRLDVFGVDDTTRTLQHWRWSN
jgi:hypothetical protein